MAIRLGSIVGCLSDQQNGYTSSCMFDAEVDFSILCCQHSMLRIEQIGNCWWDIYGSFSGINVQQTLGYP